MLILIMQADNGYVITLQNNNKSTYFVAGDIKQTMEIVDGILKSEVKPTATPRELQ